MKGLVIVLNFLIACAFTAALLTCSGKQWRCADESGCVSDSQLCDFNKDCKDLSDERPALCKLIHQSRRQGNCQTGQVYSHYGCRFISDSCGQRLMSHSGSDNVCKELTGGLKSAVRDYCPPADEENNRTERIFSYLAASFNGSVWGKEEKSSCPPLYVNIDGTCVALFTLAEVPWSEARQFCESISGNLGNINNITEYVSVLRYLQQSAITSNFWVGGFYNEDRKSWEWLDGEKIEMGAPFWSIYQPLDSCHKRGSSDVCYKYSLMPKNDSGAACVSIDYKTFYYLSDQKCSEKRSPFCVYVGGSSDLQTILQ